MKLSWKNRMYIVTSFCQYFCQLHISADCGPNNFWYYLTCLYYCLNIYFSVDYCNGIMLEKSQFIWYFLFPGNELSMFQKKMKLYDLTRSFNLIFHLRCVRRTCGVTGHAASTVWHMIEVIILQCNYFENLQVYMRPSLCQQTELPCFQNRWYYMNCRTLSAGFFGWTSFTQRDLCQCRYALLFDM